MTNKHLLKNNKGVILSDAIVATLIILLFGGIIISLITSIIVERTRIKLNSMNIDIATDVFEYVEKIPFNYVTAENIIAYINGKNLEFLSAGTSLDSLTTQSKVQISVEDYIPEGRSLNLVKIVNLNIQTLISDKTYSMQVSRVKKATMEDIEEQL